MDKTVLISLCEQGFTISQLAKHFTCSKGTVRYWLDRFELKTKRGSRGKIPKDYIIPRKCSFCGETNPDRFYNNKRVTCAKCHNNDVVSRSKAMGNRIIAALGGACFLCGYSRYNSGLDIHHLDPKDKHPNFSNIRKWSWLKVEKEIKGCVLLCKCCHAAFHSKELSNDNLIKLGALASLV